MNTFDLFSLKGKNVLITGGRAMYGQGATLALADAGANLYVASHSVESAKEFCENLSREKGVKVQAVAFDQGDIESIEKMVEFVVLAAIPLDVPIYVDMLAPRIESVFPSNFSVGLVQEVNVAHGIATIIITSAKNKLNFFFILHSP